MRFIRAGVRPAIALIVIAHGLAHAVLPLRGWMDPGMFQRDFMPLILYGVAMLGFTMAGVGLLGVKPFTAIVRPVLVIASTYSLVAIWRMGSGELWWGAALDGVLFVTGLTGLHRFLPAPAPGDHHVRHAFGVAVAAAFVLYVFGAAVLWPLHRAWGSLPGEYAMSLPGDHPDRNPSLEIQHAVTVNAPPEAVWPWLVQLGQDRAGFYSYDWLERAFGADIRNVMEIRPEWQDRKPGELVRATQPGYLGGIFGDLGWTVRDVQPERALVLQNWGAFVLQPTPDGGTRFIIRTTVGDKTIPTWAAVVNMMTFELPHFIMERRMMLQIKRLAERPHAMAGD
jgi:uncharacterized protein YndB with AHSA1/START domain